MRITPMIISMALLSITGRAGAEWIWITEASCCGSCSDPDSILKSIRELHKERRWKDLIEQYGNKDFSSWPSEHAPLACEALRLRGEAYSFTKDGKHADSDFRQALKIAPTDASVWMSLADNSANNLQDDKEALAAYQRVHKITGKSNGWMPISATLSMARILTDQVKTDEALQTLQQYGNMDGMAPIWRVKMLRAYGHVYAAQGKEQESLAKFREALRLESQK